MAVRIALGTAVLLTLQIVLPVSGRTDDTWPTPELRTIKAFDAPGTITFEE